MGGVFFGLVLKSRPFYLKTLVGNLAQDVAPVTICLGVCPYFTLVKMDDVCFIRSVPFQLFLPPQ